VEKKANERILNMRVHTERMHTHQHTHTHKAHTQHTHTHTNTHTQSAHTTHTQSAHTRNTHTPTHTQHYSEVSYRTVISYIVINKVWCFLPKNPTKKSAKYLLSDSMTALVRHSQAQKCLQINFKPLY